MFLNFLLMFISVACLINDAKQDPSEHKRAKIANGIVITLLLGYLATAYRLAGWVLKHMNKAEEKFYVSIGAISPVVNFSVFIIQIGISLAMAYLVSVMIKRKLWAKNIFLTLLPILALSEAFTFYRSWTMYGQELNDQWTGLLIGLFAYGGIAAIILWLYNRQFMKAFYLQPAK